MFPGVKRVKNDVQMGQQAARLLMAFLLPPLALAAIAWGVLGVSGEGTLVRFANALLTSFTLVCFLLLLVLVVYGDERKRPIAPLLGMVLTLAIAAGLTLFFLSQGELLMEDNGSVRAQALSNVVRMGTTLLAVTFGLVVVVGAVLATVLNTLTPPIRLEEE